MTGPSRCTALALGLALATACGSTVPLDQRSAGTLGAEAAGTPGDALGTGLGTRAPDGVSELGGSEAGAAAPIDIARQRDDAGRESAAGQDAPTGAVTGGGSTGGPAAAQSVPGMTATKILVGVYRDNAEGANAAALGFGSVGEAGTASKEDVVVEDLNRRGGVLGRKVEIVYHDYEQNSAQPLAERDQEACARWTQDSRVFAVLSEGVTEVLPSCLAKAGVPQISTVSQLRDETKFLARTPSYLQPNGIAVDRQGESYVAGLDRQKWLRSSTPADVVKVGLVTYDRPSFVAGAKTVERALKRRGHDLLVSYVKYPDSAADISQSAQHLQAAVLRFAQEGVTRAMFLDIGGAATVYFMRLADGQGYRPRYGLSSQSIPSSLRAAGAPASQLLGAVGTGWIPLHDVGLKATKPAGASACERLMNSAKQDMSTPFAKQVAMETCDKYSYFAAVTVHATELTAAGIVRAAESLRGWQSASTYTVSMAPGRHDGASAVRDFTFDTDCDCFRSVGDIQPLN